MTELVIPEGGPFRTLAEAKAFLEEHGGSFRAAAKRLHPDVGGDRRLFELAVAAREAIEGPTMIVRPSRRARRYGVARGP